MLEAVLGTMLQRMTASLALWIQQARLAPRT